MKKGEKDKIMTLDGIHSRQASLCERLGAEI